MYVNRINIYGLPLSRETHLLKIRRNTQRLNTNPQVRGNGDTILAYHGYDGATVELHNRLL